MALASSHNFFHKFFEQNKVPPFYDHISGLPDSVYNTGNLTEYLKSRINCIHNVPPYIFGNGDLVHPHFGYYSRSYQLGYAMDLTEFESATAYLRSTLNKKTYKTLRQDLQKLERDYDIRLEIHYGEIDSDLYHSLMKTLKRFIEDRFVGRTQKHSALNKWDYYVNQSLERIRSCSSILFVMYHRSQPIAISLGHTIKGVLNSAITSYDKKFSRYSLGKIMFIKELEWCFLNGFRLLDTGWGNFEYKIKFSNAIYYYSTHVLYPKKSFGKKVLAYFIGIFLEAKYYVIAIKHQRFKRPRDLYRGRWMQVGRFKNTEYRETDVTV